MPHAEYSILRARDPTTDAVIANLREVYEPELLVNVYDLGLIYDIQVEPRSCKVVMTLVSSWCPPDGYAEGCCPVEGDPLGVIAFMPGVYLHQQVTEAVSEVINGKSHSDVVGSCDNIDVEMTFEPKWNEGMMRLERGV